ncbi:hypothetical protein [Flavobacterium saccharophilum]|nr:hypothetical protein [Flavobacterium saccharophilum]
MFETSPDRGDILVMKWRDKAESRKPCLKKANCDAPETPKNDSY